MEPNSAAEPALSSTRTHGRGQTVASTPRTLAARPVGALSTAFAMAISAAVLAYSPQALALSHAPGGAVAPSVGTTHAGGTEYGVAVRSASRPTIARLSVPRTARAGRPPRIVLRIEEPGVGTVYVRAAITSLQSHRVVTARTMGWVHTGRTLVMHWSGRARLAPGAYHVTVTAHDHHGNALLRRAHASGVAAMTVTAVSPPSAPPTPPAPVPAPQLEAGVPTPAQTAADGAVFPVRGPHTYGDGFGAPRGGGRTHQGQDVLAAEGTPVAAPLAGVISSTSYQAGGAGYYIVEHTSIGFDFMYAHCEKETFMVAANQSVAAGQQLCSVGQTGDATGPHLHFEMWVGGWQASSGHPIDPLPYLEAWEH